MTTVRTTLRSLSLAALVAFAACAPIDDDGAIDTSVQGLTGAARRPRLQRIRDVAAAEGLTNGALLAGIAQVETGLSHCWSEATWACRGPNSTSCGGGPVIAGASDGPCSAQQGGLGMFQFDGGTFSQTLARDGRDILTLDGNIRHAVDFVVAIVIREVASVSTRAQALAWMNGITIARGNARLDQWVAILACRYNGACGSAAQAGRYRDATLLVYGEVGAAFWRICTPSREVCNGDDDDCDGRVDDGIAAVSCGVGACRRTVTCSGGRMAACTPGRAVTEVCGNAVDDDCDGMSDEGCAGAPSDAGPVARDAGVVEDDVPAADGGATEDAGSIGEDVEVTDDVEATEDAEVESDGGAPPVDTVVPADGMGCDVGAAGSPTRGGGAFAAAFVLGAVASRRRRR
jgi:MYXO-CTERM domain-containing protein